MKVEDLDSLVSAGSSDELIVTNQTTHKSFRQTLSNFAASIKELFQTIANLEITTLFKVTGDAQLADTAISGDVSVTGDTALADTSITGDIDITGDADITGNTQITGNLEVTGNITQQGSSYETHAEKVYTKDDIINLRDGAVAGLATGEYTGIIAKHYDQDGNDGALVFNKDGEARVGDYTTTVYTVYSSDGVTFYEDAELTTPATIPAGVTPAATGETNEYTYSILTDDTEPLLTRDEAANMVDKAILVWDAANKKAVKGPVPASANKVPVSDANGGFAWGEISQNIQAIFDSLIPKGFVYTQYPGQKNPNEMWGSFSTWEELNYGGAFFRANGGNAASFEASKTISSISGTSITISSHGLTVGSVLFDPVGNEARVVTAVTNANVIVINSAFTSMNLTNVLITQNSQNLAHSHTTNSQDIAATGPMSANATGSINFNGGIPWSDKASKTGNMDYTTVNKNFVAGSNWQTVVSSISNDVAHTHNMEHSHGTTSNGGVEARPVDFAYIIWRRIA